MSVLRLTKNFSYVFFARIITTILATGAMVFLIRYLGPKDFGIYSYVVTIMGLLGIFADCGIGLYLVGEISRDKKMVNRYFSSHILLQIFITILFLSGVFLFALSEEEVIVGKLIMVSSIGLVFSNFHIPFAIVLKGMEDMRYFIYLSIISGIATFLIIFLGIYFQLDLIYFALLTVSPGFFSFVVSFWFAKKYISFEFVSLKLIKNVLFAGLPYGLLVATGLLYNRIDILMLKSFASDNDVGLYSAAYKLVFFLNLIPTALSAALYPMLSNYCKNATDKVEYILTKLSKYILIFAVIISFYVYNYSFEIIHILFGESFIYSGIALKLLIISFIPCCARIPLSNYYLADRHIKKLSLLVLFCLVLNVLLNYYLIPIFSLYGAAVSTVFCECILLLSYYLMIARKYPSFLMNIGLIKIIPIAFIGFTGIYYLHSAFVMPFFVLYFLGCLYFLNAIKKEEISILASTIRYFLIKPQ